MAGCRTAAAVHAGCRTQPVTQGAPAACSFFARPTHRWQDPHVALRDFKERVRQYELVYEQVDDALECEALPDELAELGESGARPHVCRLGPISPPVPTRDPDCQYVVRRRVLGRV